MITFLVLLAILGVVFIIVSLGAVVLIEPIVAILIFYGIYRLIKKIISKK